MTTEKSNTDSQTFKRTTKRRKVAAYREPVSTSRGGTASESCCEKQPWKEKTTSDNTAMLSPFSLSVSLLCMSSKGLLICLCPEAVVLHPARGSACSVLIIVHRRTQSCLCCGHLGDRMRIKDVILLWRRKTVLNFIHNTTCHTAAQSGCVFKVSKLSFFLFLI